MGFARLWGELMDERPIPDLPVGPEEDTAAHRFDPAGDVRTEDVFVLARCSCGWEGNAFPESEQGYEEAELDWQKHTDASRYESQQPLDQ